MVIDEWTVVAGSFDYTEPANDYNDKNLFAIGTPYQTLPTKEGGPVDPVECTKIAKYFGAEIDRIIPASDPYQP